MSFIPQWSKCKSIISQVYLLTNKLQQRSLITIMKKIENKTKKSTSPAAKSSSNLKSSPSATKLKSTSQIRLSPTQLKDEAKQIVNSKFKKNRQKLCHTLDTYTLLIRSKNPIRCLEHNSNISIYCETQQKLLCANCIFGRTEHKFHRVTPIDRSIQKMEKDIETMSRLIDREVQAMKKTQINIYNALVAEENDAHQMLTELVQKYEECHRLLENSFISSKNKIISALQGVRIKYQTLTLELKFLMENYNLGNAMRPMNKEAYKREDLLLYDHCISSAIVSQKKFEESEWITSKNQVRNAAAFEKKKILAFFELLQKNQLKNQKQLKEKSK